MCREVMAESRVAYTLEDLRLEKIHAKLLIDAMEVYRENANNYVFTFLENFATCKNNYMYALTKNVLFKKIEHKNNGIASNMV